MTDDLERKAYALYREYIVNAARKANINGQPFSFEKWLTFSESGRDYWKRKVSR